MGEEAAGRAAIALAARTLGVPPVDVHSLAERDWVNSTVWRFGSGAPSSGGLSSGGSGSEQRGSAERAQEVVVKAGRGWTPEVVRSLHADTEALSRALGTEGRVFAVRSLGFTLTPPMLCSEYIPGEDGSVELASWLRETSGAPPGAADELVFRWGEALAAYHGASKAELSERDRVAAVGHVRRIARWLGRSTARATGALSRNENAAARSFVDVGLHNIRSTPDRRACLLDLPVERVVAPIFYDVAQALAWLDDAYRDAPLRSRSTLRKRFAPALIDGYESVSGLTLRSSEGRWLLSLYLTWCHFQWMRTAAKRRHLPDAFVRAAKGMVGLLGCPRGTWSVQSLLAT